jgi:hypothetical protein
MELPPHAHLPPLSRVPVCRQAIGDLSDTTLEDLCRQYANLQDHINECKDRLNFISRVITEELPVGDGVHIADKIVLVHVSRSAPRKLITQKLLKEVGINDTQMKKILEETDNSNKRINSLKVMVESVWNAMKGPRGRQGRQHSSDED